MSTHQGQTDAILKITVKSALTAVRWMEGEAAAGSEVGVEALCSFVGDGAPIKLTVKDSEGGSAGTAEGVVLANVFRARFKPEAKSAGKKLMFEAELTKHGLKKTSGWLNVLPPVKVKDLAWHEAATEKKADIHYQGDDVLLKAKVEEGPVNGFATVMIEALADGGQPKSYDPIDAEYKDKVVKIHWKPHGVDYHKKGKLKFNIKLLGTRTEIAAEVPYKQNPTEPKSGFALKQLKALAGKLGQHELINWVMVVFGNDLEADKVDKFREDAKAGSITNPPLVLIPRRAMWGADGKFNKETKEINISEELLAMAVKKEPGANAKLALVLLEEFGHYLDFLLRGQYGAGKPDGDATNLDEGEAFSYAIALAETYAAGKVEYATCKVKEADTKLEFDYAELKSAVEEAMASGDALEDVTQGADEFFGSGPGKDMPVPPYHSYSHQHILWEAATGFPAQYRLTDKQKLQIYFGNWVRDYSQIVDPKVIKYTGLKRKTLTAIVDVLAENSFTTPLQDVSKTRSSEYKVDEKNLGVYRPEEHIDNPKGTTDETAIDGDFRKACTAAEIAIDCDLMMKKYIKSAGGWDTAAGYVKKELEKALAKPYTPEGFMRLGFALHVVEDFFSHSNFCELALIKLGHSKVYPWVTNDGGCGGSAKAGATIAVEHEVKDGDSLAGLAQAHGITWQEITMFNWNTAVPEKVNWHLYNDVGCRKPRADDAPFNKYANYSFSSNDKRFGSGKIKIPQKRMGKTLPLVTGSFGGLDTAASLLLMLGKMMSHEQLFDPGQVTASQKIMYIILRDNYPAYAPDYAKALKDWKTFKKNNEKLWLILYHTLGVITRGIKFALGTAILAIGKHIDDAQSLAADEGTDPTHTQVGKDHNHHQFHSLAAKLAISATHRVVLEVLKAWGGDSTKQKAIDAAMDVFQNPHFTTWEEPLVRSWAAAHPAKVKKGEERIAHSHDLEEAQKTAQEWAQTPAKILKLWELLNKNK